MHRPTLQSAASKLRLGGVSIRRLHSPPKRRNASVFRSARNGCHSRASKRFLTQGILIVDVTRWDEYDMALARHNDQ